MAKQEEDREDLLREATALVERAELEIYGISEPVVAGFRRDGAASFFFGQDIAYQFNSACELRRGYFKGKLMKAERGRLVELTRQRTADSVDLVRHELTPLESAQFLGEAGKRLQMLHQILKDGKFRVVGQVPPEGAVVDRVRNWLGCLPGSNFAGRYAGFTLIALRRASGNLIASAEPASETMVMPG